MKKYPNLIKEFVANTPNQLWVSDITYWKTEVGLFYISLITDVYSHKIVGYNLAETMEAVESLKVLEMSITPKKINKNEECETIVSGFLGIKTSKVLKFETDYVSPKLRTNTSSVIKLSLMSCSSAELISVFF